MVVVAVAATTAKQKKTKIYCIQFLRHRKLSAKALQIHPNINSHYGLNFVHLYVFVVDSNLFPLQSIIDTDIKQLYNNNNNCKTKKKYFFFGCVCTTKMGIGIWENINSSHGNV